MSKDEFIDLIDQARELGARKMIILGGEPMLYPHIFEMIRYIRSLDKEVELFTNGTNITRENAQELYATGVRVILKMNTFDEKLQDTLSGRKGAYAQIQEAFNNLKLAYKYKANMLDGEEFPDPMTDSSFTKFLTDEKFINAMQEMKNTALPLLSTTTDCFATQKNIRFKGTDVFDELFPVICCEDIVRCHEGGNLEQYINILKKL